MRLVLSWLLAFLYWAIMGGVETAEKLWGVGKYKKAKILLDRTARKAKKQPKVMRDAIAAAKVRLNQVGLDLIDEAKADSDKRSAKKLLKKIEKEFKGLEAAREAKKARRALSSY